MAKNQFVRPLEVGRKLLPAEQLEAVESWAGQPTPVSQGLADPSLPRSSGTPYAPTEFPYLQAPHGLHVDPLVSSGPKPPQKKRKKPLPIWARIAIGLLVFLVIITGGAFAYYEIQVAPALNNIIGKQAIHHTDSQTSDGQTDNQNDTGAVPTGRTNILLLGSDTDGKGNDPNKGRPLAQTVMILTVDPQTSYVGMLSIPRDMQVTEKGYRAPKLDEVFSHGYTGDNLQNKIASGAGAMEDIIRFNFGIHIDYYAWVGLGGFVKVIDTAGGIDVDTIHPMVDDTYPDDVGNTTGSIYDYKRLYIPPGPQHLDGAQALDYVRTRHSDLIGDFGRTVRQQQMISELKIKLATSDTVAKTAEILQDLNGAVQTDMQLNDIVGLGNLARGIDSNKIDHLTLGPPDYAVPNTKGARTSNYLPVCGKIVPAIRKMFNIRSPKCVSTTNAVGAAACPCPSTPTAFNTAIGTTKNNAIPHTEGNSIDAGVHALLDLLFATTFETFDAMQV
jgi:LCP family protein required for cell wall assembly